MRMDVTRFSFDFSRLRNQSSKLVDRDSRDWFNWMNAIQLDEFGQLNLGSVGRDRGVQAAEGARVDTRPLVERLHLQRLAVCAPISPENLTSARVAVVCFMRHRTSLAIAALAFALVVSAARANEQPPVFGTDVSLVLVPVFAVDEHGRAVQGLRAEDFQIQEDGRRAQIVSFRYVDTTSDDNEAEERGLASAARRRFLLLFDMSFTTVGGLSRARRSAGAFVRTSLRESDLAAVATLDANRGVRLVANFTDDRALLAHAVDSLGVPSISKISDPLALAADLGADIATPGRLGDLESTQVALDSVIAVQLRQMRDADLAQYRANVERTTAALYELARALRNVAGRKQIVYFSGGFDSRLLVGEEGYEQQRSANAVLEGRLWDVDGEARYGDARVRDLLASATQ